MPPPDRAPVSRRTRRASTKAAMPPFISEAPEPCSTPCSKRGGTKGRWTVSRCPSNCRVRPGLPLSRRVTTAGDSGQSATGRSTLNPSSPRMAASRSAAAPALRVGLGTSTRAVAVCSRRSGLTDASSVSVMEWGRVSSAMFFSSCPFVNRLAFAPHDGAGHTRVKLPVVVEDEPRIDTNTDGPRLLRRRYGRMPTWERGRPARTRLGTALTISSTRLGRQRSHDFAST